MSCSIFQLRRQVIAVGGIVVASFILCGLAAFADEPNERGSKSLTKQLLTRAGTQRGVCSVAASDGTVALDLVRSSELLVHVREPNRELAAELRQEAEEAGLGIDRLVIDQGPLNRLPFADNMVDVVIVTRASTDVLEALSSKEVLRVLRPGGTAIVGKALGSDGPDVKLETLEQWSKVDGTERTNAAVDDYGTWVQVFKSFPQGIDEWTHWEKSPDNNPVSGDSVIKAPYMTHFMAKPLYIGMPSITTAAGGRTFLAIGHIAHHEREWDTLNKIIARNGYNGTVLWERSLPEGYLVHRSAFIATADAFHMIDGESCLLLDPATGKEKGRIRIPDIAGEWKWMVINDGVMYVLAGKPDGGVTTIKGDREFGGWSWADLSKEYYGKHPIGFGDTLAAYDLETQDRLWLHKEETLIDSRGMAIRDGKVYLYCPDRHLRALNAETGEVVWTNGEQRVFNLIEEPGRGLTSTPGWRTQTLVVATPKALIIQGQTRNNVIAISTEDGYLLWTKRKITNNPNAIYVDGNVVLGVGEGGSHVVIDPVSGDVKEDLNFGKRACTRLTACADSFFVRGEGTLRFDRESKQVLVDGAQRPACNDGAMPAHGLLYLGPWQCDCNLSLIGYIAKCSAGDFQFDVDAAAEERLEIAADDIAAVDALEQLETDWPTYRGNNRRSAGTSVKAPASVKFRWEYSPPREFTPTAPVAVGGLVFSSGDDGKVRAIDAGNGSLRWQFSTPGAVTYPPTIFEGRAYIGSSDGFVYCLEAASGRLVWRFRAAPVERQLMVYDRLSSTWPVGSGVLVDNGVAYFAAGIIDHDGTYVYALDAKTGELRWQNNSSGHLSDELRKGVSVQGNLSLFRDQLLLAGGNQVSPAQFDIKTGQCLAKPFDQGQPKANNGRYVGVFRDKGAVVGGRILYSAPENVATKGSYTVFGAKGAFQLNFGGVPPAWNDDSVAFVNFKHGKLTCCDADKLDELIEKGPDGAGRPSDRRRWGSLAEELERQQAIRWQTDLDQPNKFETVSLAVCPNAIVAVVKYQQAFRAHPQWYLAAFDTKTGKPLYQQELNGTPLPDGLLVDRNGQIVVSMLDGRLVCYGG